MTMQRFAAIDVLRGLTLALMILVNTPGSWSHVYAPLLHAHWNGATPTDFIFPFFLFIVGAAMFYSLKQARLSNTIPWFKIIKRTALLFLIGLVLNIYPFTSPAEDWRVMGVLQRIALCYFFAAILIIKIPTKTLIITSAGLLIFYWSLLVFGSAEPYSLENNVVRKIDLLLIGASHLYQGTGVAFDPEGLLGTLSATVTTLSGYLSCLWLQNINSHGKQIRALLFGAVALTIASMLWQLVHPINKSLWTGSYVLLTTAGAWCLLAVIIWAWEIKNWRMGLESMRIFGTNPLFIYILSWLIASTLASVIEFEWNGKTLSAYDAGFLWLNQFLSANNASLAFALINVAALYLIALFMYRKNIFIKL
jgi:predicted acyltransferase